jgi:hypothetical protein
MDVTTYLRKNEPELTMPQTQTGADDLGIRYEGPVLSGIVGVKHQLELHAASSPQSSAKIREIAPGGAAYVNPADQGFCYHGIPIEPDPLKDWQRQELGNRPELYDPVLRAHSGLPPLPDPYEERRRIAECCRRERENHVTR